MSLATGNVFATIAVSDIEAGKEFYGGTLGLRQTDENLGGVMYESGTGKLFVYESQTAGKGEATCAGWEVEDVVTAVAELKTRGVPFETYPEMPGVEWQGEIAVVESMKTAWFRDPDGNILAVGSY